MIRQSVLRLSSQRRRLPQRRGVILITALGIIVILAAMVLAYAVSMRSEAMASANRLSYAQADAVEQAAEMWVLAQADSYAPDAITITQTPAEGVQVGAGYFWILHPDPNQYQTYAFGITDEAGKVNINTTNATQLSNLPYLQDEPEVADNIVAWAQGSAADAQGAPSQYYDSLQEPYETRMDFGLNANFETMDELLLVENVTPQMLYGQDLNRNGVLEASEQNNDGNTMIQSGSDDPRGFFNFVTCYSKVPAANPNSTLASVNVSTLTANNPISLQNALANLPDANTVISSITSALPPGNRPSRWTIGQFYTNSGMSATDFGQIFDQLTSTAGGANAAVPLNVNTASAAAFGCLPWLTPADGQNLADAQADGITNGNITWFMNALPTSLQPVQIQDIVSSITDRSYQYSADIVAVSGDGRSFKRVRIVVNAAGIASTTQYMPAQIVYRKDLTALGWPLDPAIRTAMRQGHSPPDANSTTNNASGILPQTNQ
jgi:type II secretory pathway component PulK